MMAIQNYIDVKHAVWGWHPDRKEHEDGLTLFRRVVRCDKEVEFQLAVSADARFNFYLDGALLGRGPLRSCPEHYYYDEYAGKLNAGTHIFAAEVLAWRSAWRTSTAPWAEMHVGGGFFVSGYAGDERMEVTEAWVTSIDNGYRSLNWAENWSGSCTVPAPPFEKINLKFHDYEWLVAETPSGKWVPPSIVGTAVFHRQYQRDPDTPWHLEPRPLPQMQQYFVPLAAILTPREGFMIQDGVLSATCPAGKYSILIDAGKNQTVMVKMTGRGGGGCCRIAYSEALFDTDNQRQQHMPGTIDSRGCADQLEFPGDRRKWEFRSFWYRTGRFYELQFDLKTPIQNLCMKVEFISYPFKQWIPFCAPDDPVLQKIYQVGCHTLQCCSHETFEDCPYYEQLQYAGDSRIEALASYAATGDDSLGRQCLKMIGYSQLSNGMTQSRYPSVFEQVIPGYSLIWALMIYDHYCIFRDKALIRELLPKVLFMLGAFEAGRRGDGLIDTPEGWHFSDWTKDWYIGCADRGEMIPDTLHNLFYAETCRRVAELQEEIGKDHTVLCARWQQTITAVNQLCYDKKRDRYSDAPGREWFSLHSNVLAILSGAVQRERRKEFLQTILADETITQTSLYFEFYVLLAIQRWTDGETMRKRLVKWEKMLDYGFTTFPETPTLSRSLCHAWSAAPVWFLHNKTLLLLHPEREI